MLVENLNRQRQNKMVNQRHMHKIMLQILKDSEMVIKNKFKVKNLTIHTYTEELLKEISKRARIYAIEPEEEPTTSNDLQEVFDDILNNDDDDKERCEEMVQALSTIIQTEDQTEEMKTEESIEMPDFQTLMELSLDNEELKDDMLVDIPYISS